MPSVGGGGRGGGGSFGGGGGFRGNSFNTGGGGFGGGRGPRYGYGFGFFPFFGGGLLGILLFPFILIILAVMIVMLTFLGAFGAIVEGGVIMHDSDRIEDFAMTQYEEIFAEEGYESNILLVFLVVEEHDNGEYLALVGDDVSNEVYMMFGGNGAELDVAMQQSINQESYKNQLSRGIATVLSKMSAHITRGGYATTPSAPVPEETFRNLSNMTTLSAETIEKATAEFAAETGINIAIVVEDATDVLEVSYAPMIWGVVIAVGITALAVFLIVKSTKSRKKEKLNNRNSRYHNDHYYGF